MIKKKCDHSRGEIELIQTFFKKYVNNHVYTLLNTIVTLASTNKIYIELVLNGHRTQTVDFHNSFGGLLYDVFF